MQMPGMDGIEMCRRLKQETKTAIIPVILITAHHASADLRARGLEAGADDFIDRPIDNIELVARIRTMLRIKDAEDRLRSGKAELERQVARQTATLREYRKAVESSHDLIAVIDRQYCYSLVNDAWVSVFGMAREQVIGRSVAEVLGEEEFESKIRSPLESCLAGRPVQYERNISRSPGSPLLLQVQLTPISGDDGSIEGVVSTLRDVTREREAERMKDEFIAVAAHELNTPLAVIHGYAELLRDESEEAPYQRQQRQEFLSLILEKSECLQKIVDDLLDLSRVDSGRILVLHKSHWRVRDELGRQVRQFQRETAKHRFDVCCGDLCGEVLADRSKIGQVLENLIGNAIKYSPQGGPIRLQAEVDGALLRVTVADQGIGMTAEQVGRAFEKFYRADTLDTAVGGLGLGLAIAGSIIEAHGGRIWLESEVNQGTCVHFTLPLSLEGHGGAKRGEQNDCNEMEEIWQHGDG
jgi:PAS domain S-box-containing protein